MPDQPSPSYEELAARIAALEGELAERDVENARLFNELQERNREVSEALDQQTAVAGVLQAIRRAAFDLNTVLDQLTEQANRLVGADLSGIQKLEGDTLVNVSAYPKNTPEAEAALRIAFPPGVFSVPRFAMESGQPVYFTAGADNPVLDLPGQEAVREFYGVFGTATTAILPLLGTQGAVGTLTVTRRGATEFTDAEKALLQTFADQAVIAIENARLFNELQERNREVSEALRRQEATSEVLEQISNSPEDLEATLNRVAAAATSLCNAQGAGFWIADGDDVQSFYFVEEGTYGGLSKEAFINRAPREVALAIGRPPSETTRYDDVTVDDRFPAAFREYLRATHQRSVAMTPVKVSDQIVGLLNVVRDHVEPFSEAEASMLEAFADQAAIALSNAWLLRDLRERNREVSEALDQQTAMAEVLGIIAASPTDVSPVLEAIVARAASICDAREANLSFVEDGRSWPVARWWAPGIQPTSVPMEPTSNEGRMVGEVVDTRAPIHFSGRMDEFFERYPRSAPFVTGAAEGMVTLSTLPLLRGEAVVGALFVYGTGDAPFTARQQAALEAFADQAVIAVENARLFNELQERNREVSEALDVQTAVAEILEVISKSPTTVEPVLDAITETAGRLFHVSGAVLWRPVDGMLEAWSRSGPDVPPIGYRMPIDAPVAGEAFTTKRTINFRLAEASGEYLARYRALTDVPLGEALVLPPFILAAPLIRGEDVLGVFGLAKLEGQPFSEREATLLEAFADQAVIAIENARLFNELQERNREVSEALRRQEATSEILRQISSTPEEFEATLKSIAVAAQRLCRAQGAGLWLFEGEDVVAYGSVEAGAFGGRTVDQFVTRVPRSALPMNQVESLVAYEDAATDPRVSERMRPYYAATGQHSSAAAPVKVGADRVGYLGLGRDHVEPFSGAELALLESFADQAGIAIANARLIGELRERNREVSEALDQQTAMAEVLGIIAASPTDVSPVLEAIVARAASICDAREAALSFVEDGRSWPVARWWAPGGEPPSIPMEPTSMEPTSNEGRMIGEVVETKAPIHFSGRMDEFLERYPQSAPFVTGVGEGMVTLSTLPLLRGDAVVGALFVFGAGDAPFTARQQAALEAFADQAVIAIENARLFNELQERNREVSEALERQEATTEILRQISSTPEEFKATLESIAVGAQRLCRAQGSAMWIFEGEDIVGYGSTEEGAFGARPFDQFVTRLPRSANPMPAPETVVVYEDATTDPRLPEGMRTYYAATGQRSSAAAPVRVGGERVGVLGLARDHIEPFSESEIALLESFADQAGIAIANARLIGELRERNREVSEALRREEATGEILQQISRAPEQLSQTLEAIALAARQLCGSQGAGFWMREGDKVVPYVSREEGSFGGLPEEVLNEPISLRGYSREFIGRRTRKGAINIADLSASEEFTPEQRRRAREKFQHSMVHAPVLVGDEPVGMLVVARDHVEPFGHSEMMLLESLADQAGIAVSNARLLGELRERTAELEVASRHKSEFLANMSHELRTPLNAIIGYSELLQEEATDLGDEDYIPDLKRIHTAGRHLLTLISGILDLSKIEAGRMTMYLEDFDIATLARDTEEIVRPLVEKNGNSFEIVCPPDAGAMRADLVKARQVLFNLLSNAAKFTENGAVTMTVRVDRAAGQVEFAVKDSGIGMNEEQMDGLFEAFSQADASISQKYGGTGLGLALSRQFCVMMGGDIRVASQEGVGSTFTAILPLTVVEPS